MFETKDLSLVEIRFLQTVFNHDPFVNQHFRLIPVYTLYMALRFRLSSLNPINQTFDDVIRLVYRIENLLHQTIDVIFSSRFHFHPSSF